MDSFDSSQIGSMVRTIMNDDFAVIASLTFFLCEGIFNVFPVERARMKQLTALAIGGALGYFLLHGSPIDDVVRGVLAGGAATVTVAKFKRPSVAAIEESAPVSLVPYVPPARPAEPVEHL